MAGIQDGLEDSLLVEAWHVGFGLLALGVYLGFNACSWFGFQGLGRGGGP